MLNGAAQAVRTTGELALGRSIQILNDAELLRSKIEELRWQHNRICPRCRSTATKEVRSAVFKGMYRCIDCTYMFNAASGTIFQGTKLPLNRILQALIIVDAFGKDVNPKDIVYALDVSYKTASLLRAKLAEAPDSESYFVIDRSITQQLLSEGGIVRATANGGDANEKFHTYCDSNGIAFYPDLLQTRLKQVTQ